MFWSVCACVVSKVSSSIIRKECRRILISLLKSPLRSYIVGTKMRVVGASRLARRSRAGPASLSKERVVHWRFCVDAA